jgi:hypothetical protein
VPDADRVDHDPRAAEAARLVSHDLQVTALGVARLGI